MLFKFLYNTKITHGTIRIMNSKFIFFELINNNINHIKKILVDKPLTPSAMLNVLINKYIQKNVNI